MSGRDPSDSHPEDSHPEGRAEPTGAGGPAGAGRLRRRDTAPALSVVVLTHDRAALLRRTLRSVLAQAFDDFELLVVDNASRDDTASLVRDEFPQARLLRLEENTGIRGRNLGFREARSELILSLDDDIELVDPSTFERLVERFAAQSDLGALTLKICEDAAAAEFASHHWWHAPPRDAAQDREFPTEHINEAAVAFRAEALARCGFYYERLFWGGEEWDLTLGMLDAGFDVRYLPLPVRHLAPRGSLNERADARHALLVRNRCWIAFRRLPLAVALGFALPRLALWAVRALRFGYTREYLSGVVGLVRAAPELLRERAPIARRTRRRIRRIRGQARGALLP